MFHGDYNFFDYKYNIVGYNGQDYGSFPQYLYLIISVVLLVILLFLLRKSSREKIKKIIRIMGIFLIVFYISKTTWESIYDIKYSGSFNTGLLPLDTCSLPMIAYILAGFTTKKTEDYSKSWMVTGGIVGGFATMLFLNAFKYYPFLSFGAMYSMIWHFIMVFMGLLLIVTNYVDYNYKTLLKGFIFHILFSLIVIPLDYIFNWDFMMYKNMGSIPIFEDIGTKLNNASLGFLNPIIMMVLYFLAFNLIFFVIYGIKKLMIKLKKNHNNTNKKS